MAIRCSTAIRRNPATILPIRDSRLSQDLLRNMDIRLRRDIRLILAILRTQDFLRCPDMPLPFSQD